MDGADLNFAPPFKKKKEEKKICPNRYRFYRERSSLNPLEEDQKKR